MKIKVWVGWLLAGVLSASAQGVPDLFNYQGVLRGGSGELLAAGSYDVGFKLYSVATGGSAVWGRQYAVLVDSNGLFNVELDDGAGSELIAAATLPATVSGHEALYLGDVAAPADGRKGDAAFCRHVVAGLEVVYHEKLVRRQ